MSKDFTPEVSDYSFPEPIHEIGPRCAEKPNHTNEQQQDQKIMFYVSGILNRKPLIDHISDSYWHMMR